MKLNKDTYTIELEDEQEMRAIVTATSWAIKHAQEEVYPSLIGDELDMPLLKKARGMSEEINEDLYNEL